MVVALHDRQDRATVCDSVHESKAPWTVTSLSESDVKYREGATR